MDSAWVGVIGGLGGVIVGALAEGWRAKASFRRDKQWAIQKDSTKRGRPAQRSFDPKFPLYVLRHTSATLALLDGVDLREYDVEDLYREIGVIFQDFMRYEMTARENIAVGRIEEMDNLPLLQAAADKSLADDVIERLPASYEQMLGRRFDGGVDLSGGEWQKVALARAYLRDAQVLILDEPTAALDARSEYEVFQRFAELTAGKSALFISHRFSTVRMADRIVVLENGKIVEDGNHEALFSLGGRYAGMFEMQAASYR